MQNARTHRILNVADPVNIDFYHYSFSVMLLFVRFASSFFSMDFACFCSHFVSIDHSGNVERSRDFGGMSEKREN